MAPLVKQATDWETAIAGLVRATVRANPKGFRASIRPLETNPHEVLVGGGVHEVPGKVD